MSQEKKKIVKVGQMKKSRAGNDYIQLGSTAQKDAKYNYTVDVRVTMGNGEKVLLKNPNLFFSDPRKNAKKPGNVPDFILSDLIFIPEDKA